MVENLKKMPLNIKILCTSRELPDINQLFSDSSKVYIHARDDDVENYLKERIEKSARLRKHVQADSTLLQTIVEKVIQRVDGMFVLPPLSLGPRLTTTLNTGFSLRNWISKSCPKNRIEGLYDER